jgi:tetratricopeptide (TPR) repeat protein
MVWDRKEKLGAFVTPKDPPVADFTRSAVRAYVDAYPSLPAPLVYARVVYDALGVLGLKYIVDPTSSFQQVSGESAAVDYLQYPRDTLARKSGDCDDLSILFAASMENLAIGTAFVEVPGHVFIMFNTGVSALDKATLGFPEELLVVHEGSVWIPVEMTMVGSSFTRAWQKGAEEFRDWTARGKVNIVDTRKSWELFKPVTLPRSDAAPVAVARDDIEKAYKDELETLARQRLTSLSAVYLAALGKDPDDVPALGELGILYGENGLYAEALEQFKKILAQDKSNAPALNNSGNIHLAQDRLSEAKAAYEASLAAEPGDPGVMANLARVIEKTGNKEEAKKLFQEAAAIDPRVIRQYEDLASGLGVVK